MDSESWIKQLIDRSPVAMLVSSGVGKHVEWVNHKFTELFGYTLEEIPDVDHWWPLAYPDKQYREEMKAQWNEQMRKASLENREIEPVEATVLCKNGSRRFIEFRTSPIGEKHLVTFIDLTERKLAEQERLAHLRFFESMNRVNQVMLGTNDLEQVLQDVLDVLLEVFNCDRAWLTYPCDPDADTLIIPIERTRPEYPGLQPGATGLPVDASGAETFRILLAANGPVKFGPGGERQVPEIIRKNFKVQSYIAMALYPRVGKPWSFGLHQCSYARVWSTEDEQLFQSIGRRLSDSLTGLLIYRNLQESEERYRRLVEISPDGIGIYTDGKVVFANSALIHMHGGKTPEDVIGKPVMDLIHPKYREEVRKRMEEHSVYEGAVPSITDVPLMEQQFLRFDGSALDVEVAAVPFQLQGKRYAQVVVRDITQRKRHEMEREAMIAVSTALRKVTTRAEILTIILGQLVNLFAAEGAMLATPDPVRRGLHFEMGHGGASEKLATFNMPADGSPNKWINEVNEWVMQNKQPYLNNQADPVRFQHSQDQLAGAHCLAAVPLIARDQAIGVLWIARQTDLVEQDLRLFIAIADIAANAIHRVTLHEQTVEQLNHLVALHQIDTAIVSSFDLGVTLSILLNHVKNELAVDATSILLYNPVSQALDYQAGIGFNTQSIERSHIRLGEGCAGRAALEYRTITCLDYPQNQEAGLRARLLADEKFNAYLVAPLVVKGQVKGVLEVFHRQPLEPEQEWLNFFETLATQAAIAIEGTFLFENLQRTNTQLTLAYDATIEGWSRALDLRDKETEGHTLRVTEMTLQLAEKMGISGLEKVNLRRGALLHDIGKMGVPDTILLKPGPLDEEEWEIMRKHTTYAYEMLSPIEYLRPALDIPYCHHEKWDGSGYPRGLKGRTIPMAARVFAVVDVFDALVMNRPYRKAWTEENVFAYIQDQAGRHFDPEVAAAFLELWQTGRVV